MIRFANISSCVHVVGSHQLELLAGQCAFVWVLEQIRSHYHRIENTVAFGTHICRTFELVQGETM